MTTSAFPPHLLYVLACRKINGWKAMKLQICVKKDPKMTPAHATTKLSWYGFEKRRTLSEEVIAGRAQIGLLAAKM